METKINIAEFLDTTGKIVQLSKKKNLRYAILKYLADKFETNHYYTEKQVNDICNEWHTFGDYFLIRRELIESGLFCRKVDGSLYWKHLIN